MEKANKAFEEEHTKEQERESASEHLNNLQKLLPRYEQIEVLSKRVQSLQVSEKEARNSLVTIEQQLNAEKEKVVQLNQLIEQLEDKTENYNEILEQQSYLKQVINLFSSFNQLKHELQGLQLNVNTVEKEYQSAKQIYEVEEGKWLTNQASRLAASLVPGSPCPVCGSIEHGQISSQHTEMVDETTIKKLKANLAEVEQTKYRAEAKMNSQIAQVTQCEQELERLNAPIEKEQQIIHQFNELNLKIEQLKMMKQS